MNAKRASIAPVLALLAALAPPALPAESVGSFPDLAEYSAQAHEVVVGRVLKVERAARGACFSDEKGISYEFSLSRADVRVERALYNASPGDKRVFFCDALHLERAADKRSAEFPWDLPGFYHFACGLPLSFATGERVLLFLNRSSSLPWPYVFAELTDDREPKTLKPFAAERASSYFVYSSQDAAGLGGKFSVRGEPGAEELVAQPVLRAVAAEEGTAVRGSDSWLWPGEKPRDHDAELAALVRPKAAKVPLERAVAALAEVRAAAEAAPPAKLEYATGWRRPGEPAVLELGFAFGNRSGKRYRYVIESADAGTGSGRKPIDLRFTVGDEPGWDGWLEPYRTTTASARARLDAANAVELVRVRVRGSDGKVFELEAKDVVLKSLD